MMRYLGLFRQAPQTLERLSRRYAPLILNRLCATGVRNTRATLSGSRETTRSEMLPRSLAIETPASSRNRRPRLRERTEENRRLR